MEINGIAHVFLTVSNFDTCVEFYEPLLNALGMKTVVKFGGYLYCVGGRTAVGIAAADPQYAGERFVQQRIGLHHLCFRARERADVDACYELVRKLGGKIAGWLQHRPHRYPQAQARCGHRRIAADDAAERMTPQKANPLLVLVSEVGKARPANGSPGEP
jgi:catechol 2,3-dioxygenase-like lactoylglutathione lyase family enzyme